MITLIIIFTLVVFTFGSLPFTCRARLIAIAFDLASMASCTGMLASTRWALHAEQDALPDYHCEASLVSQHL
jgi:hypothetical protein